MAAKTPVSILQELMVAHHKALPVYIESGFGTEFTCTVKTDMITAQGSGTSKKSAKQEAAKNAVKMIRGKSIGKKIIVIPHILPTSNTSITNVFKNYVGELNEFASLKSLSYPVYEFMDCTSSGNFVVSCTFCQLRTTGNGLNKKDSKQDAAKRMLELLETNKDVVTPVFKKCSEVDIANRKEIIETFQMLSMSGDDINMKKSLQIENIEADPTIICDVYESIDSLKEQLRKLNIPYKVAMFRNRPPIASFLVEDSEFTLLAMGETTDEAVYNVLRKAVRARECGCDFSKIFPTD